MIRHAEGKDLAGIMPIFSMARLFMRRNGNNEQWINGYPSEELIARDIENGNFYVEERNGKITGCFAFLTGEEPTYRSILGAWPDNAPYGTIHRLASDGSVKKFTDRCIDFCSQMIPNLRADTHRCNLPMQKALLRNGFRYCGIIHVADGSERLAYCLNRTEPIKLSGSARVTGHH